MRAIKFAVSLETMKTLTPVVGKMLRFSRGMYLI
jgi:hypothetical protein